jgi:putative oxidoreductase
MLQQWFGGLASWGPDFLRLGAGVIFIMHGYPKLFGPKPGPKGFAGYLQSMGFSPPLLWAYVVGIAEFVGGVCLILGFLTRFWALVLAIQFLVIILRVKWAKGLDMGKGGFEYDWALLMMALSLLVTGPGRVALDHRITTGL